MNSSMDTEWVPIERIRTHPENFNRMSEENFAKLSLGIKAGDGRYPPVIVRSLERSQAYKDLYQEGLLQIIDGEHRYKHELAAGAKEVLCCVFKGVTDEKALEYLNTLNYLHGEPDKRRRAEAIRKLAASFESIEEMAKRLPWTHEQIERLVKTDPAIAGAKVEAEKALRNIAGLEPLTIFCEPEQKERISRAIDMWLEANDPDGGIVQARQGRALAEICMDAFPGCV